MHYYLNYNLRKFLMHANEHTKLLLLGDGRSGTTWIADVLNYDGRYLDFFESYHGQRVLRLPESRIYPTDEDFASIPTHFKKYVLSSKIFADQQKPRGFAVSGCFVKDITAHMIFSLIFQEFDYRIYIIRNPLSVALSKEGYGRWHSNEDLQKLINSSPKLRAMSDCCFSRSLVKSRFHEYVLVWCLLNKIAFPRVLSNAFVIFYEDFLLKPEQSSYDLFAYIEQEYRFKKYRSRILGSVNKSSKTSVDSYPIKDGATHLRAWERYKSKMEISLAYQIIEIFELDYLYQDKIVPQNVPKKD